MTERENTHLEVFNSAANIEGSFAVKASSFTVIEDSLATAAFCSADRSGAGGRAGAETGATAGVRDIAGAWMGTVEVGARVSGGRKILLSGVVEVALASKSAPRERMVPVEEVTGVVVVVVVVVVATEAAVAAVVAVVEVVVVGEPALGRKAVTPPERFPWRGAGHPEVSFEIKLKTTLEPSGRCVSG